MELSSSSDEDYLTPQVNHTRTFNNQDGILPSEEGSYVVRHLNQVTPDDRRENNYRKNPKLLNEPTVESQVMQSAIPPRLRKDEYQRTKSNSTSSLFVDFTIANPVVSEIIECLSTALYCNIKQSEVKGPPPDGPITMVFSEERFPLNNDYDFENSPSISKIKYFFESNF